MSDEAQDLSGFGGVARLFPLPDFVLFPRVVAPLHIFEPRYRQMTADALDGDRLIALVLLKPGWEEDYETPPPIHEMACLAQIMNEQRLPDGRFNLLVRGLTRLRLRKEVPTAKLYRLAQGWPLPDPPHDPPTELRDDLTAAALALLPDKGPAGARMQDLFKSKMSLGSLCDVISFALPLSSATKQSLLEELDIAERVRRLVRELQSGSIAELLPLPHERLRFPPDFSAN